MTDCLIGHTGFVGSALARQREFGRLVNSRNFRGMRGESFDTVVCCGVSAVKWMANREPEADLAAIRALADVLAEVRARRFVLISTVDVYAEADLRSGTAFEDTPAADGAHHAYGRHRLWLEGRMAETFPSLHVLRLPALFGPGLRKNALFDMVHGRLLDQVDPDAAFGWYDLSRLSDDVDSAVAADLPLANLGAEPVSNAAVRDALFPGLEIGAALPEGRRSPLYDLRTRHARVFGGSGDYLYDADETLDRIAAWARTPGCVAPNPDVPSPGAR